MMPEKIEGATHALGAPDGMTDDQCGALHVKLVIDPDIGPELYSVWRPSPEELARLAAGARVVLCVVGEGHPAVSLGVEA